MLLKRRKSTPDGLPSWPLLDEIDARRRRRVERHLRSLQAEPGTRLAVQNLVGRDFYLLASGHVGVDQDGERIDELGPGDFFGEIALLTGGPRTATVVTLDDVVVEQMNRRRFAAVLDAWPDLADLVISQAKTRLRTAT